MAFERGPLVTSGHRREDDGEDDARQGERGGDCEQGKARPP
ncbi:hypothetical protein [Trebonia sp.]|nr:hypothetical protein [Trebonia sp.]